MAITPFLGQLKYFSFNFAPKGWALADGQLLPINQDQALFSLFGVQYGGDGHSTFALPDLKGRVPIHQGQGSGLSNYVIGQKVGAETQTLTTSTLPAHTHALTGSSTKATSQNPNQAGGALLARAVSDGGPMVPDIYTPAIVQGSPVATVNLAAQSLVAAGAAGPTPYPTVQPYMTVTCGVALQGIFPAQN